MKPGDLLKAKIGFQTNCGTLVIPQDSIVLLTKIKVTSVEFGVTTFTFLYNGLIYKSSTFRTIKEISEQFEVINS